MTRAARLFRLTSVSLLWVALLGSLACSTTGAVRQKWTRYEVGKVEFFSAAPKRATSQLLYDFARFRIVVKTLSTSTSVEPRVPTKVFLFPDHHSFHRETDRTRSGGVFVNRGGNFTLALDASRGSSDGQELLFHEYSHLIVDNVEGLTFPAWYHEGMAEFMATMRFSGDEVRLGEVSPRNRRAIGEYNRWVPLPELLQGDLFKERSDSERLHRYYAQAWLLAHYLQMSERGDTDQLADYLQRVHDGGDPVTSVKVAFGVSTHALEKELREYVRQGQISYQLLPQTEFDFSGVDWPKPVVISEGEAALELATLCVRIGNFERAATLADAAEAGGQAGPRLDTIREALPGA